MIKKELLFLMLFCSVYSSQESGSYSSGSGKSLSAKLSRREKDAIDKQIILHLSRRNKQYPFFTQSAGSQGLKRRSPINKKKT